MAKKRLQGCIIFVGRSFRVAMAFFSRHQTFSMGLRSDEDVGHGTYLVLGEMLLISVCSAVSRTVARCAVFHQKAGPADLL
jgi:hypothetical protein